MSGGTVDEAEARRLCGYKTTLNACKNCAHFKSERVLPEWMRKKNEAGAIPYKVETYGVERNMRCALHDFKTKRSAVCNAWRAAGEADPSGAA